MAGFLVLMGTVADRFGHRNLLITSAALFGIVSVVAAFTNDPTMMIVWRAVLGIAAAMQMSATFGLILTIFRDAKQRGVAIGTPATWAPSYSWHPRDAFFGGLNAGAATAAVIVAVGAVPAATLLRHVPPTGSTVPATDTTVHQEGVARTASTAADRAPQSVAGGRRLAPRPTVSMAAGVISPTGPNLSTDLSFVRKLNRPGVSGGSWG